MGVRPEIRNPSRLAPRKSSLLPHRPLISSSQLGPMSGLGLAAVRARVAFRDRGGG